MKRLLTFVIVLSMVLCTVAPVSAAINPAGSVKTYLDAGENFESKKIVTSEGARFKVEGYEGGIGGKNASDTSVKVVGLDDPDSDANTWYHQAPSIVNCTEGYVVMSVDLFVIDGVDYFYFGARQNNSICPAVNFTDEMKNRWVNITTVYNTETVTCDTYLDGGIISSDYIPGNFRGYDGSDTTQVSGTVRWICSGEIGGLCYMDNFKLYSCTQEPVITENFGITGHLYDTYVEVSEGLSFAEAFTLSDNSASVKIYADRSYTTELGVTEKLVNGSYIVISKGGELHTYYVKIDNGIDVYDSVDNGQFSFVNGEVEFETTMGLFGKPADDNSAKITKADSLTAFSEYTWLADDFSGYIRADFNLEAGNVTSLSIGTDSNKPVSGNLTLNANQWNRVSVIYDTNSYNSSTGLGVATTYVNGVKQSEIETPFYNLRHLRIMLEGETGSYAYADDFTMTHFDERIAELSNPAVPSNATVSNGIAYFTTGVTVSDIKASIPGTTIRVYNDVNFTTLLDSSATLTPGNYIVMETLDMVYSYYPVALADADNLFEVTKAADISANKLSLVRGKLTSVYGFGGKDKSDESIKLELSSIGANKETDTYIQYTWPNANSARYVVTEFNVFPNDASNVRLLTNGHAGLSGNIPLVANQWNKAVVVYDTQKPGSVQVYTNGAFVRTSSTDFTTGKTIRLSISCGEIGKSMYIDDFKVYETNGGAVITMPDLSHYYDVAADGSISVDGGTALSELNSGDLTLRAYTDNTYTAEVPGVEDLATGNVIVAEDAYKGLSYYKVVTNVTKNVLAYSYDGTFTKISGVGYTGAVGGVMGKEASDKVAEFAIRSGSDNSSYAEFSYNSPSETGYLVVEATVYLSDAIDSMQFGTGSHTALTNKDFFKFRKNQWNKVMYVYNCAKRFGELYVNGVKQGEGTPPDKFLTSTNAIRIICRGIGGSKFYFDDMTVYETNVYPEAGKPAQVKDNMKYLLYDYSLFMTSATEYADLSSLFQVGDSTVVRFLDENNNIIEVSNGDTLPKDAVYMTLYTGRANYTAYKVRVTDFYNGVVYGPAYDEETGNATTGTLKIAVPIENLSKECVIAVAAYSDKEVLEDVWLYKADASSMYVNCDIPVDAAKYARIGVMVVNNMEKITPYAPAINIPVK